MITFNAPNDLVLNIAIQDILSNNEPVKNNLAQATGLINVAFEMINRELAKSSLFCSQFTWTSVSVMRRPGIPETTGDENEEVH
jgi:hypothetical protein